MAESRGSLLAKSVQKHAGRAKEKVSSQQVDLEFFPDQVLNSCVFTE